MTNHATLSESTIGDYGDATTARTRGLRSSARPGAAHPAPAIIENGSVEAQRGSDGSLDGGSNCEVSCSGDRHTPGAYSARLLAHSSHRQRLARMPAAPGESIGTADISDARHAPPRRAMRIAVFVLSAFALWTLRELLPALLLGAWLAAVTEPLSVRVARALGGRTRAAALLTVGVATTMLLAVTVLLLPVVADVRVALHDFRRFFPDGHRPLGFPLGRSAPAGFALARDLAPLVSQTVAFAASAVMQIVVFLVAAYYLAIDGRRLRVGLERCAPFGAEQTRAFLDEFIAVGRGIAVSMGLAALATAAALGTVFVLVDAPRPLPLAALSFVAAMIPIGAPLVWVPVAVALLARGRESAAIAVVAVGLFVVSGLVDHVLRPWLVRFGRLTLHPLLTLLGLFGGVLAFGPWGIFLGPLVLAMTATAIRLNAERPLLARRSVVPGERVTIVSMVPPPAPVAPAPIVPG